LEILIRLYGKTSANFFLFFVPTDSYPIRLIFLLVNSHQSKENPNASCRFVIIDFYSFKIFPTIQLLQSNFPIINPLLQCIEKQTSKERCKTSHRTTILCRLVAEMLRIKIDGDQEQGTLLIDVNP